MSIETMEREIAELKQRLERVEAKVEKRAARRLAGVDWVAKRR